METSSVAHLSDQNRRHILGPSTAGPLAFPGNEDTDVLAMGDSQRVSGGYDQIAGYVEADQVFTVAIYQGADVANLSLVFTFNSVAIGARQVTQIRYPVFGEYIRIVITNAGGNNMTVYSRSIWIMPSHAYLAGFYAGLPATVQGADPVGAAPVFNPFVAAGVNLAGNVVRLQLYAAGNAAPTTGIYVYGVTSAGNLAGIPIGTQGVAAPTNTVPNSSIYQVVPTVAADGQAVRRQADAYGHDEPAFHNRALGSAQITDISPVMLAKQTVQFRASAALPAAGAYDAAPTEVPTGGMCQLTIHLSYDEAAVGGRVRIIIYGAMLVAGADVWRPLVLGEQQAAVLGAGILTYIEPGIYEFDPLTTGLEGVSIPLDIAGGWYKVRIAAAESGVIGTPGTCQIDGTFWNG